jgi:hypothetical protein
VRKAKPGMPQQPLSHGRDRCILAAYVAEGCRVMEYLLDFGLDRLGERTRLASLLDPHRYLREADLALLYGSRDDAVALIAQAYLAFDLRAADFH